MCELCVAGWCDAAPAYRSKDKGRKRVSRDAKNEVGERREATDEACSKSNERERDDRKAQRKKTKKEGKGEKEVCVFICIPSGSA